MNFNVACSKSIDPIINYIGTGFKRPIKKTLYESDVGEEATEITLIPISISDDAVVDFTKHVFHIIKAMPGVIFIEPVREEVIIYDIDT